MEARARAIPANGKAVRYADLNGPEALRHGMKRSHDTTTASRGSK